MNIAKSQYSKPKPGDHYLVQYIKYNKVNIIALPDYLRLTDMQDVMSHQVN